MPAKNAAEIIVQPVVAQHQSKSQSCSVLNSLDIAGQYNLTLHTTASAPHFILQGDARDLANITVFVRHGVLHARVGKGYPHFGALHLEVWAKQLRSVHYLGTGNIIGQDLQSNQLDLAINNNGKTNLQGNLSLRELKIGGAGFTQISNIHSNRLSIQLSGTGRVQLVGVANMTTVVTSGDAWLSLYWVKSHVLKLRLHDNGYLQLAGVVDVLDAELWKQAHFNGRYLRATRLFVKTHDNSVAEIATTLRQHTLATDSSNIYYYNMPQMHTDLMACSGSVLDMRDWRNKD